MGSLFKRLTRGIKFDDNRFATDALKLQIVPNTATFTKSVEEKVAVTKTETTSRQSKKRKREKIDDASDLDIFSSGSTSGNKNEPTATTTEDEQILKPDAKGKKRKAKNLELQKHKEKISHIRKASRIHIWGEDLPDPIEKFEDTTDIPNSMVYNIRNLGIHIPSPVQMQAIPIISSGRDLLACAPTGSGKTLAFLVPLIANLSKNTEKAGFRAVVLAPTRELAAQLYRECVHLSQKTGLSIALLNKQAIADRIYKKGAQYDILISTPNRLVHGLKQDSINLDKAEYLIVDECDHLFEVGFRDQLGYIYSACDSINIKRAFFSATCAFEVEQFCKTNLNSPIILAIGAKNSAVDLIKQELTFTGTESGKLMELRDLVQHGIEPPMLIFVQTQERCNELFAELTYMSVPCGVIHSGKTEPQREAIVNSFREGKILILISTALLARGMDFPAIKTVLNFDMPVSHIQYIHSIGRTGRAGKIGRAITFFTEDDKENLRRIAQVLENSGFPTPPYMLKLKKGRKDKNRKLAVPERQSISKMSGYDYSKKKKLIQMIKQSAAKNPDGSGDTNKMGKKLKNLERRLEKEKKYRSIEKNAVQKRKSATKKPNPKKKTDEQNGVPKKAAAKEKVKSNKTQKHTKAKRS